MHKYDEKVLDLAMASKTPWLEIIIPVRIHAGRKDIIRRIEELSEILSSTDSISILVVEDGSASEYRDELYERLAGKSVTVISTDRDYTEKFSLSITRNQGAIFSNSPFIMFLDADLVAYPEFFDDLRRELSIIGIEQDSQQFLMCPVIYLTAEGRERWNACDPQMRRQFFISETLKGDSNLIEKYSTGTSVVVLRREYFLSLGGYDEGFTGWGYEDYEFGCRLVQRAAQFPMPKNWSSMSGNFMSINRFTGWKSVYRLHGDWLAQKGIWLFHLPHPIDQQYHGNKAANMALLRGKLDSNPSKLNLPVPLPNQNTDISLFLSRNPFCYSWEIAPFFGHAIFASDDDYADENALSETIKRNSVTRIVFPNPYRDKQTLAAYKWCRKTDFPFTVCERGALPGSIFHDSTGFLSDGYSYNPSKWDKPLTSDQRKRVEDYMLGVFNQTPALEKQPPRIGADNERNRLKVPAKKKVLLVAFQQPHDTVIQHFSGSIGSFENFVKLVSSLPEQLGSEWQVVCKKHPAEDTIAHLPGTIAVEDGNIYDLIEMCDSMLVINSGTGIYGMMLGKPVHIVGTSWYADDRMNRYEDNLKNIAEKIMKSFSPDMETVTRFIHYLRFEFYSFGIQKQNRSRSRDGSPITSTSSIKYTEVRHLPTIPVFYSGEHVSCNTDSLLFDRYFIDQGSDTHRADRIRQHPNQRITRLVTKLRRAPHDFFRDSKYSCLQILRHFFSP